MINDEALVQTKSLLTQLSLTTNQRNPGCLVIAGNTGNVVCNTSFTDLSDSRVKTEIAEADVAELLQLFDSVEAKQYKRPDMNGDLRLRFASDDFAGTKWKNLTGATRGGATARRWSPSTTLTSPACSGGCARASRPGWTSWKPGRPSGGRRTSKHGADDFNARDPRKLYQLARQRDLDVTQAMAFEALKADVGRQVQAPRPRALGKSAAEGPNDRLQADLIDFSQNTRGKTKYGLVVMDVFTREAAVEPLQNKNAETVGRATKRAARELTGDDGNFVVTTDLGNEFATLDRELPAEAVHRTKRPEDRNAIAVVDRGIQTLKKDLATRVARKGGQWSDHFERAAGAYNARPQGRRGEAAGHGVQGPPRQRRQVPAQQGPDKPPHQGSGGRGRFPSTDPQYGDAQQLRAVDSMTVRSTEAREMLLKLQRQRGGPTDEAAQAGSCQAAGRLPGASKAQHPKSLGRRHYKNLNPHVRVLDLSTCPSKTSRPQKPQALRHLTRVGHLRCAQDSKGWTAFSLRKHTICSRDLPGLCKWLTLYVTQKPKSYLPIGASHPPCAHFA